MSIESRKNNSVSFNLLDDFELKLLEHAEKVNSRTNKKRNFSRYVKRLIEEDMMKEQNQGIVSVNEVVHHEKTTTDTPVEEIKHNVIIENNEVDEDKAILKMYL